MGFWQTSSGPVIALAPMEDVTDTVFREIILSVSDPARLHVVFTEFTSVDGLDHEEGREAVSQRLKVTESERALLSRKGIRLVAQIWGSDPEKFYRVSKMLDSEYLFDGIDINMGCPVRKIIKHGSCSALITQPRLAAEIIEATREGCNLPVSVKTRIGFDRVETEPWISCLLATGAEAIIIHGRTQKMLSEGRADWDEIAKAARLRDALSPGKSIIGNGDLMSHDQAIRLVKQTGCDGAMIGRGVFSNPWFFSADDSERSAVSKIDLLRKHINLFLKISGNTKNFAVMKRFFKIYIHGFADASILRNDLMNASGPEEVLAILDSFGEPAETGRQGNPERNQL